MHEDGTFEKWAELIRSTRRAIADGILRSEILRIARLVPAIAAADDALAERAACFPVYRTYLPHGAEHLEQASTEAALRQPDLASTFDSLRPVLFDAEHPAAQRLQSTTGTVTAKGVEDTAFYRYSRLASLTEVGGDPAEFSIDLEEFHRRQQDRQAVFSASLTSLSTHGTKRGEDVHARIDVLSEVPGAWRDTLSTLRRLAPLGDGPLESILWESTIGAWPASAERLQARAEKAPREYRMSTRAVSCGKPHLSISTTDVTGLRVADADALRARRRSLASRRWPRSGKAARHQPGSKGQAGPPGAVHSVRATVRRRCGGRSPRGV
jgi:(1->4)-alpha-D-glucan 1-alpha-D-glucosylmutase